MKHSLIWNRPVRGLWATAPRWVQLRRIMAQAGPGKEIKKTSEQAGAWAPPFRRQVMALDKALTRFWRKKTVKRTLQKSVKFLPIPS
jgi:hypothetical protein